MDVLMILVGVPAAALALSGFGLQCEPQVTGNHANTKRQEQAAIKKALNSGRFLLPMHDRPARIENGKVVAAAERNAIPGPEVAAEASPVHVHH